MHTDPVDEEQGDSHESADVEQALDKEGSESDDFDREDPLNQPVFSTITGTYRHPKRFGASNSGELPLWLSFLIFRLVSNPGLSEIYLLTTVRNFVLV